MKRVIGLLTIASLFACVCRWTYAADAPPTDAQIKAVLGQRAAKLGPNASIVFGWVDETGARVIAQGKGAGKKALGGDSVFEIGSGRKAVPWGAAAGLG